jgi:type IX secretion system PorP/SprF family membrane protein
MRKHLLVAFILSFASAAINAQQIEDFSLLRENAFILNPAVAGTDGWLHGFATFRKEFLQINQSPYTALYAMNGLLASKNIGLGGYLMDDVTGPTSKAEANLAFAYNLPLAKRYSNAEPDHVLSFGASVSIVQYRLDGSQLHPNNPGDPGLVNTSVYKIFPDATFGIYYKYKDNFFAGVSIPQIMGLNIDYQGKDGTAEIKTVQQFNLLLGGKIPFNKGKLSIDPVADFRYEKGAPPQGDIGLRFTVKNLVWVGYNYRSLNISVFEAGFNVKDIFKLSYAYDLNMASYTQEVGGTHEICLSFNVIKTSKIWRGVGAAPRF